MPRVPPASPNAPLARPGADEYPTFFAPYVEAVGGYHPFALLGSQVNALRALSETITESMGLHRYAAGKWSVKETLGHLSDAERMVSYWLFRIGRGDATPLAGYDEHSYVTAGEFDGRSLADLIEEFECVRGASLRLIASTSAEAWGRWGVFKDAPMTARAVGYILPGHVEHHLELLRTRYGVQVPSMEQRYGPAPA